MKPVLYLYPGPSCPAAGRNSRMLASHAQAFLPHGIVLLGGARPEGEFLEQMLRRELPARRVADLILAQIAAAPVKAHATMIVDEGALVHHDLSPFADLSRQFDIKVIHLLRRQDLWLESWYKGNVLSGRDHRLAQMSFPEFLSCRGDFHWIDHDRTLRRLEAVFGASNVIAEVVEATQMPGDPMAVLVKALGLGGVQNLFADVGGAGLSPWMTEFVRSLSLSGLDPDQRHAVLAACRVADAALVHEFPQSPFYMDSFTRRAVMSDYDEGNAAVARRRFGRTKLFQEPLPPDDAPLARQTLPANSYETLRLIVAPVLAELAGQAARRG